MDRLRFVLRLVPVQSRLVDEGVEQSPDRAAGDAEVVLDAVGLEPRRKGVDDAHVPASTSRDPACAGIAASLNRSIVMWQQIMLLSTRIATRGRTADG